MKIGALFLFLVGSMSCTYVSQHEMCRQKFTEGTIDFTNCLQEGDAYYDECKKYGFIEGTTDFDKCLQGEHLK